MRLPLPVLSIALAALNGCGNGSPEITGTAAGSLDRRTAEVRAAAEARAPDDVKAKLAEFRAEVQVLRERGQLSGQRAARVLAALAGVEQELPLITTTTSQPTPPPPQNVHDDDDEADD